MSRQFLLLAAACIMSFATLPAQAASCDTLNIKVNGLVCDFCARAVEKVFGAREEVGSIKVDLDRGQIDLGLKPGRTIDDETVKKLVTDSGYSLVSVDRECREGGHG